MLLYSLRHLILLVIGNVPLYHVRLFVYRLIGMRIGHSTRIYMGAEIRAPSRIKIGNTTSIGHRAILDGRGGLRIGDNVNFGTGVWVWTAEHDINSPDFAVRKEPVTIGDYVWCSARVTILPGVQIGEGAVIAAGAVVAKDVEPYTVVGGVPARPIGERTRHLRYKLSEHHYFI